jgi:YjbE family integral membrane protein
LLDLLEPGKLAALFQVVAIDIVLAGVNAVVIGMAAARVPKNLRGQVIFWGLSAAVLLRIALAIITVSLFKIIGLILAGGILLLWVCWRFWREIRSAHEDLHAAAGGVAAPPPTRQESRAMVRRAALSIMLADLSMSLDNVLGVAGAAIKHMDVLVIGLLLSITFMGIAANYIARLLQRYIWISYVGLAIVFYVALSMIWEGGNAVLAAL